MCDPPGVVGVERLSPVSSSICCTHVRQGRPRWRFHSGLMSGLPPMRASAARRSAEWASVASGSRRTWPKMESRLRQMRIVKPSSPVWLVPEAFVTKWNQRIPKIRRWQFMWNASNRRSSWLYRVRQNKIFQHENCYVSEMPEYFCAKFRSFVCHNTVH